MDGSFLHLEWCEKTVAEGVGFEPTVGYPTLDFESSALNRTQPPFPQLRKKTSNGPSRTGGQRPISNAECNLFDVRCSALGVGRWALALGFEVRGFPFFD